MSAKPNRKLPFASDYQQGAYPSILARLGEVNMEANDGYGADAHCERARQLIREACANPSAEVHFLVGGTQANAVAIDALLMPWQGVIAASSGHISLHEAGAVEANGHKVLELPGTRGKLAAADVDACALAWETHDSRNHMVMPGLVYISQPTEYGTLYSLQELEELRKACDAHDLRLYVDGARLAYALAAPDNSVGLPDLARLADAFYIGGTKCGALLGEALVLAKPGICPHFFAQMKRHGAVLAKGMLLGVQFETLFEDGLYQRIGVEAVAQAAGIARALEAAGCQVVHSHATNQVFVALDGERLAWLSDRVDMCFWERLEDGRTVMRLATSWASLQEDVDALVELLAKNDGA